ncbi:hypothetical protein NQ318_015238, partial [Aromia moschata]
EAAAAPTGEGRRSNAREALPQILAVCVKNVLLLGFGMTLGFPTILIPSLSGSDPKEKISLGEEAISWIELPHGTGELRCTQSPSALLGIVSGVPLNLICVPVGCLLSGAITQPLGRKRAMQMVNIPFLPAWLLFHFSNEPWQIFLALCITGLTGGLLEAPNVEGEFQELRKQIERVEQKVDAEDCKNQSSRANSVLDHVRLFSRKSFTWPFSVVALAFFLGHFNGNTTLQVYSIKIFSVLNTPINEYYATILLGTVQIVGSIMCASFVNILGKRIINFISLLGSGLCFIIVAAYAFVSHVEYFDDTNNGTTNGTTQNSLHAYVYEEYRWVPTTFLVLSAFLTYFGIKILPWILTGEVYYNEIRATASGLSGCVGYIFGFVSNKIFLSLVSHITLPGVFLFYGSVSLGGTVLLYCLLPETEGKSLFEITEHFAGRSELSNKVRRKPRDLSGERNKGFEPDSKVYPVNWRAEKSLSTLTYVAEITTPNLRGILASTSTIAVISGVLIQFLPRDILSLEKSGSGQLHYACDIIYTPLLRAGESVIFSGMTTLQTYAVKIFSTLKAPIDKYYATIFLGFAQVSGCILSACLVYVVGKRKMNFFSLIGTGICFTVVATYAYLIDVNHFDAPVVNKTQNVTLDENSLIKQHNWIPMTFLIAAAFCTHAGIRILPWMLIGEVYSSETRAVASGFSGFLVLYFVLPETEGKTLFEITQHFAGTGKLDNKVFKHRSHLNGQINSAYVSEDKKCENVESKL